MSIQYMNNGIWREANKQEFLTLVQHGIISPLTEVIVNGQKAVASQIKGVVFPDKSVAITPIREEQPACEMSKCTTDIPPVKNGARKRVVKHKMSNGDIAAIATAIVCIVAFIALFFWACYMCFFTGDVNKHVIRAVVMALAFGVWPLLKFWWSSLPSVKPKNRWLP
jgi:hypothetical protein